MRLFPAKNDWQSLVRWGVWLVGITSPFVFPPPTEVGADSGKVFALFSAFALSVIIGVLTGPLTRKRRLKDLKLWSTVALIALILGAMAFFQYHRLRSSLSAEYAGTRVVIGSEFTREGEAYKAGEAGFTKEQAIMDAAGQPAKIWTVDSIHMNAMQLCTAYFLTVMLFSLAVISGIQAYHCGRKRTLA
ncbi:MAG TPA: hypothetical protein VGK01_04305 [Candidatus Angelobacter sp.]|jgi:hypothetical protein